MTKKGPTINKHKRGNYYTTITISGKKKFIYGKDEDEVLEKYYEAKYKAGQGYNVADNPTMLDYCLRWYDLYKRGKGSIKTQQMYASVLNAHIIPALGKMRVKDVVTSDVQTVLNAADTSKSLQHKVRITLNQIFKKAQGDRLIASSPVVGTDPVETPDPIRLFYTPEQRAILLEILQDHYLYPFVYFILHTGVRATEALALMKKRDIDLDARKIYVRESTEFIKSKPQKSKTKTDRGVREIPLPIAFTAWLDSYMRSVNSLYLFPGHHGGQRGLTEHTNRWRQANRWIEKWFKEHPDQKEHKFKLYFKTLRHTYCTELFDLGVDEVSAAKIMGHTVSVMREIYTHLQKTRRKQTAVKIDSLYENNVVQLEKSR
jgi:integrase